MSEATRYPRTITLSGSEIELRMMTAADEALVLDFARNLPSHDLLFLKRDITQPRVLSAWVKEIEAGSIVSLLAIGGGRLLGCTAVVKDDLSFSPHVGDLRVLLAPEQRQKGLGRVLIQESFLLALGQGLEKLTAHMTPDQQGAISVFEGMGFRAEALLKDHVRDGSGTKHDIVILSHDVAEFQARFEQYGLNEAF